MQAKGVAPEILRDKALSLQHLNRIATQDEEEEQEELNMVNVSTAATTAKRCISSKWAVIFLLYRRQLLCY
jgi:hypothetical protein